MAFVLNDGAVWKEQESLQRNRNTVVQVPLFMWPVARRFTFRHCRQFLCFISQPTQAHLHADPALTCRYLSLVEGKELTE